MIVLVYKYKFLGGLFMSLKRKRIFGMINIIVIILLILLYHILYKEFLPIRRNLEMPQFDIYRTLMRLNMLAIGVAIEGKRLYRGIKGKFHIHWLGLTLSIFLVLLSMVPLELSIDLGMLSFGYSLANPLQTFSWVVTNGVGLSMISLLGGIGIIRSITSDSASQI